MDISGCEVIARIVDCSEVCTLSMNRSSSLQQRLLRVKRRQVTCKHLKRAFQGNLLLAISHVCTRATSTQRLIIELESIKTFRKRLRAVIRIASSKANLNCLLEAIACEHSGHIISMMLVPKLKMFPGHQQRHRPQVSQSLPIDRQCWVQSPNRTLYLPPLNRE